MSICVCGCSAYFFFKQKTAYEMRISDWSSDVCSSDLAVDQYGGLSRMVNRNDDTVTAVLVGGRAVFLDGELTDLVGHQRTGRFLRAAHKEIGRASCRERGCQYV